MQHKTATDYKRLVDFAEQRRAVIAQRTAEALALTQSVRNANADRHVANALPIILEAQKAPGRVRVTVRNQYEKMVLPTRIELTPTLQGAFGRPERRGRCPG
jgi:hypothetical protein